MKLRNKNFIQLFLIHLLIYPVICSPKCFIKFACKGICEQFTLINGINSEQTFSIGVTSSEVDSINYYQSSLEFECEPGDKITFSNTNNNVGIAFYLKIKDDNNVDIIYKTGGNNNILGLSSICISDTENIVIDGQNVNLCQYVGDRANFIIKIPYEFENPNKEYDNVLYPEGIAFEFKDIFNPTIKGAQTDGRIKIKITNILDSNKAEIKKEESGNINIDTNTIILLNEKISFKPKNNNFGKFTINFQIIILEENTQEFSIDFIVCYKYCSTCIQYDESNNNDYACLSCIVGYYLIDNGSGGNVNNRCYSTTEIDDQFSDYYLSSTSSKYEKCHVSCATCIKSESNCLTCASGYNFYEGYGNECLEDNDSRISSFQLNSFNLGNTYMKCDSVCNQCSIFKENCINCQSGYYKVQDEGDYCYLPEEIIHLFGKNYYLNNSGKYQKCEDGCEYCKLDADSQTRCIKCFKDLYLIEGQCKSKSDIENDPDNYHEYFLPSMSDTYIKCNTNCSSCNYTEEYCIKCNDGYALFEEDHKCYVSKDGYFIDETDIKKFKKCNKSCKKCSSEFI